MILNFNLSDNSLGRAYLLAQMLSRDYEVRITGPLIKGKIWEPLRNSEIPFTVLPYAKFPALLFKLPCILKEIDGELIYAIKPRFTSFGLALLKKMVSHTPVILDIDDWEVGFFLKKGFLSRLSRLTHILNPNGLFWTWVLEFFVPLADRVTTVSSFLQSRFGGDIIPHAKDISILNPELVRTDRLRMELGLEGKRIVMFCGTPREHKGVEDALKGVLMIDDPNLVMVVVGANLEGEYENRLREIGGERLIMVGFRPLGEIPHYLGMADVVVVPQRDTPDTVGQIPSKLLDAMAMGRPVISTSVSDIPEILDGCGIIVPPGSPEAIRDALVWIIANPDEARLLGIKARERCIALFSMETVRKRLKEIVDGLLRERR